MPVGAVLAPPARQGFVASFDTAACAPAGGPASAAYSPAAAATAIAAASSAAAADGAAAAVAASATGAAAGAALAAAPAGAAAGAAGAAAAVGASEPRALRADDSIVRPSSNAEGIVRSDAALLIIDGVRLHYATVLPPPRSAAPADVAEALQRNGASYAGAPHTPSRLHAACCRYRI